MNDQLPKVTITIPVLNEIRYIEQVLDAILAQDYPADKLEVILADGISTDGTQGVIQRYINESENLHHHNPGPTIRLLKNPDRIVSTGLNAAIREAQGDVIVRVDAHTIIDKDYVRQCVAALDKSQADGVGGAMVSRGIGYTAEAIALATSSPFGIGNSVYRTSRFLQERFVETTHMGAYRKETLFNVGLFNEQLVRHQDYELDYRIRQNGGTIFLVPDIKSHYFVRGNLRKLWRQYFQYGFWKGRFLRENFRSLKWRHSVPPLFVLGLIGAILLTLVMPEIGKFLLILILIPYILLLLAGAGYTCRNREYFKFIPILPIIFPCLHVSWGLGVWLGALIPDKYSPKRWPR